MKLNNLTLLSFFLLLMTSCSDEREMQSLKNELSAKKKSFIETLKNEPTTKIPRLKVATYHQRDRTPFELAAIVSGEKKSIQPLNMFSLATLRFVGTVSQGGKIWAIIITPDNLTYKVKLGDTLGDHYGKIIDIGNSQIKIMESYTENEKTTTQRVVTLQLKDEQ